MKNKKRLFATVLFVITYILYFVALKSINCYVDSKFVNCDISALYNKSYYMAFFYIIAVFIICHNVFKYRAEFYGYFCVFLTLFNFILYYDFLIMFPYKICSLNCDFKLSMLLVIIEPLCLWTGFYLVKTKIGQKKIVKNNKKNSTLNR